MYSKKKKEKKERLSEISMKKNVILGGTVFEKFSRSVFTIFSIFRFLIYFQFFFFFLSSSSIFFSLWD